MYIEMKPKTVIITRIKHESEINWFNFFKESVCFCICKIKGILAQSDKCNESCSSDGACHHDDHFNVYTKCKYCIFNLDKTFVIFKSVSLANNFLMWRINRVQCSFWNKQPKENFFRKDSTLFPFFKC